jgi:hypothetical protein
LTITPAYGMLNKTTPNITMVVGEPIIGVNLNIIEGRLGSPNPSANLIGVHQAYDESQFE